MFMTGLMKNGQPSALAKIMGMAAAGLASFMFSAAPGWALTTQQVAEKLGGVPVYTMGILEGNQVTFLQESITQESGESIRVSRVYLKMEDAQNDLNQLKANNSELPANVSIATVSLGEVYCISQQNQTDRCTGQAPSTEEPPAFIYFPDRAQLTQAVGMLREQGVDLGENTPLFVPLFLAQFQRAGEEPRTVPAIYFSVDNLQTDLNTAKQNQPELANVNINVQVTTLDRVIQQLKAQNDPDLGLVQFVPLRTGAANPTAPN